MARLPPGWSLSTLVLLSYVVSTCALSCTSPERALPQDSCLLPQTTPTASWADSGAGCEALRHMGLAVVTDEQFTSLTLYAEVLGRGGELYWLGYMYSSALQLQDTSMTNVSTDSALLVAGNYGDGVDPAEGVCVAISGSDRLLHRRLCSELHASFCRRVIEAPSADTSVDPSRFITQPGSPVNLSCIPSSAGTEVTWVASIPSAQGPQPISQTNTFIATAEGAYYCIVSNELGGFVLDPVVLVAGPDATSGAEIPSVTITATGGGPPYAFGSSFSLDCEFNSIVSNIQWFINGRPVVETSMVALTSTLAVEGFQEEGYYQCFVSTDEGLTAGASLLVNARASRPGGVDQVSAEPNSRDQLFVTWLCPEFPNTHDVALLRYSVQYRAGRTFDSGAVIMSDAVPVLLNGSESGDCVVETVISNLMMGTTYVVRVVAMMSDLMGEEADNFAVATTYGAVPPVIKDLRVTRAPDNKQLLAEWDRVKTTPPMGMVSRYQIQYRDFKGSISTTFHSRRYNYLVVNNVVNANGYEVRVSSGVVVQRDPVLYEYSNFTAWVKANAIGNITPTQVALNTLPPSRLSVEAASIAVGVLVFILIFAILAMGLFCCVYKRLDPRRLDKKMVELELSEQKLPG